MSSRSVYRRRPWPGRARPRLAGNRRRGARGEDRRPKLARASSPTTEIAAHPSVGVDHEGVGIERGETRRDLSSDLVGDRWGAEQQKLVVGGAAAKARPGTKHVERTGLGRSRDDADQSAGELNARSRAPWGRRRVSARRRRMTRRRGARSGTSHPPRDPAERDRPAGGLGARARGHPPDDAAVGEERDPAPRLALDAESHQVRSSGSAAHALERGLPDEPRLVHRDGPLQAELRRMVVRQRVLSEVQVTLLQPEDVEGAQPEGLGALRRPPRATRRELGTARAVVVELETDLADEADPERTAGHVRRR